MSDKKYIDKQYLLETLRNFDKDILSQKYSNESQVIIPYIDSETKHWFIGDTDTGIVAEGKDGLQGVKGDRGDKGEQGNKGDQGIQGIQGVQGIKGDKGDDGYPFLIYKEYNDISQFSVNDFPQIGLMFMIKAENSITFPVYRYTGESETPYSFITNLSNSESIKGDKGEKGDQGEQGIQGVQGEKGNNATINGENVLTIQEGEGIELHQENSSLTISSVHGYLKKVTISDVDPSTVSSGELVLVYE